MCGNQCAFVMMGSMRKIMILGAGEGQVPLIRRAKAANYYVLVVSPHGDYPGFEYADECFYENISAVEKVFKIAREQRIDAIATDQTDVAVPTVQYVAERLDLPCIECSDIRNFQIKSRMRDACKSFDVCSIPYCVTHDRKEAWNFYNKLDSCAIIKPIDSQGSRGVHLIACEDDFNDAYDDAVRYSKSQTIIIEKYIKGQEVEVDSVLFDGKIISILIGDVFNFSLKDTFSAYERVYPSFLSQGCQQRISSINEQVLLALGLRTGWTHGEYIVEEGTGNVFFLEMGARGGGNYIGSDIVRLQLGIGTDEMAFRTATGDDSFYALVHPPCCYCAYKCFYLPEGVVVGVHLDEPYLQRPFIVTHNLQSLRLGLKTNKNTDKTSRYTVLFQASSREELISLLKDMPNHIDVQVLTTEGRKGVVWK